MHKKFSKIFSVLLAVLLIISAVPLQIFAAVDINPWKSTDVNNNVFLDALKYTGYNISQFTVNGKYGSGVPAGSLSGIGYNAGGATGLETNGGKPNISAFKRKGMCCASYAAYVYFNYLPNVLGVDTSFLAKPTNPRSTTSWHDACEKWVSSGKATKISLGFSTQPGASGQDKLKNVPIGAILIFKNSSGYQHTGLYAGTKNGHYFQSNVGNSRGPEINLIDGFQKNGYLTVEAAYVPIYDVPVQRGHIAVNKKSTNGNNLSGAVFTATNTATNESFVIGPTNENGYAISQSLIPFGTYKVRETVFPTNYHSYGQTEWTVTLDNNTPNATVTINAVNEIDKGSVKIIKTSEDGKVSDIEFTISGNGVNKTVKTNAKGEILIDNLVPGKYTVTEKVYDKYNPQESQEVTVVSNGTAVVTFDNTLRRGSLTVIKTSEDNLVEGVKFKLTGTAVSGDAVEQYAVTDASGKAEFKNILIGTYIVSEVDTPNYYVVPDDQTTVIEWNKVASLTFNNALKKGNVKIVKTSEDGFIEGISFRLTGVSDSGTTVNAMAVTNSNGVAEFKNVLIGSDYTVTEIDTNEQYIIPSPIDVNVEWNKVTTGSIQNILKRGSLEILKVDGLNETPLKGVGYRVFNESGSKVAEGYTDENGILLFENLPYGKYTYQEIKAPVGFVIDETIYDFAIIEDGQLISVRQENDAIVGSIHIHKIDPQNHSLSNVSFLLEYSTDGGATYQPVSARADTDKITVGGCTSPNLQNGILATDENGEAVFTGLRISTQTGKIIYRVTETETQKGFQLLGDFAFEGELTENGDVNVELTVVNAPIFSLPATGGNSLLLLMAVGSTLLLVGAYFLFNAINKKSKRKGKNNMKNFKKILVLGLTVVMALSTMTAVFAANSNTATIDTSKKASFDLYKYDFTSANEDGILEWHSYVSDGKKNSEVENTLADYALKGVVFSYIKVADIITYSESESDGYKNTILYSFKNGEKTNSFLADLGLSIADAYISDSKSCSFRSDTLNKALLAKLETNSSAIKNDMEKFVENYDGVAMPETNANGYSSASGLDLGLYLVVETSVPENVYSTTAPFLLSLPMTTIDGLDWNYNVTVYPKNETNMPTLEKTLRESKLDTGKHNGTSNDVCDGYTHMATGSAGDAIEYQFISTLPSITSAATALTEYTFTDTLCKGLEYNKNDVKIEWFKDSECKNLITTWDENDGKFSVNYGISSNNATTMTIRMTTAGLNAINFSSDAYDSSSLYSGYSDCTARITYSCTVNSSEDVVCGDDGNDNIVVLTWRRSNMDYSDTLTDDCHFYTYGIDLTKKFSDATGDFANVKFLIHNDTDNYWVTAELDEGKGIYYVTDHKSSEDDATAFVPVLTNGDDGKIIIKGLEDDEYTVTEIKTDTGYTLLKNAIKVVITSEQNGEFCTVCGNTELVATASVDGKSVTMNADKGSLNALAPFKVINHRHFGIPLTGAEGAFKLALFAGGILFASIAFVVFFSIRRKRNRK